MDNKQEKNQRYITYCTVEAYGAMQHLVCVYAARLPYN